MKVSVYKLPDGTMDVMVEASPGMGKAPVVIQGITDKNVQAQVLPLVKAMRGRRVLPFVPDK